RGTGDQDIDLDPRGTTPFLRAAGLVALLEVGLGPAVFLVPAIDESRRYRLSEQIIDKKLKRHAASLLELPAAAVVEVKLPFMTVHRWGDGGVAAIVRVDLDVIAEVPQHLPDRVGADPFAIDILGP